MLQLSNQMHFLCTLADGESRWYLKSQRIMGQIVMEWMCGCVHCDVLGN